MPQLCAFHLFSTDKRSHFITGKHYLGCFSAVVYILCHFIDVTFIQDYYHIKYAAF